MNPTELPAGSRRKNLVSLPAALLGLKVLIVTFV